MRSFTRSIPFLRFGFLLTAYAASIAPARAIEQSITLYGGPASHNTASEVFVHGEFRIDGPMLGLAYDRGLADLGSGFALEGELQATHFFIDAAYSTVGVALGLRYD